MSRRLATISLVLTAAFVLIILALHFLRPDVDPMLFGISFYAIGEFGQFLDFALSLVGLSGILLAFSLWPRFSSSIARAGLVLLSVWGIASILAGIFPLDAPGAQTTLSGTIHNLAGLNFLIVVPAVLMIELARSDVRRELRPRPTTYWLAWLLLIAAIALFVFNGPMHALNVGGAFQRLYWLVLVLWLFLKAAYCRSAALAPTA